MSEAGVRSRVAAALAPLDRPLTSYYLIIGTAGPLLAIGLVMVLSTSSASQLDGGQSPYSVFIHQLVGVIAGLVIIWGLSKAPPRFFRMIAHPMLLIAMGSLVLVLIFGTEVDGAKRWIEIAGIQIQPSEFAKLAFLLWGADLLARKEKLKQLNDWRELLVPLLPAAAVLGLLVILGDDLGTTFLLLVILLALLWVVGTPARLFVGMLGLIGFMLLLLIEVADYRSGRITGFLHPTLSNDWQLVQGKYAIGSGGLLGVGLGDSQQKWGWVPNDDTDFIFAILGEELGLVGTVGVVLLFGGLAYAGLRVARRVTDPFMRFAATGAVAWIAGQAIVNICAVLGMLPITGVPLPLISQGLSSILATMAAIGMLLSFARYEPGAAEALAAVKPRLWSRLARSKLTEPPARARPPRAGPERAGPAPARSPSQARPGQARSAQARAASGRPAQARSASGRPVQGGLAQGKPVPGRPAPARSQVPRPRRLTDPSDSEVR